MPLRAVKTTKTLRAIVVCAIVAGGLAACSSNDEDQLVSGLTPAEADALNNAAAQLDDIKPPPRLTSDQPLTNDTQAR